ncbi:hypothetical protein C8R46DRAFT_49130 [Mycena filopes]|nr:hypothetical protein C8R46DRAFT_49130 [Mycena filopes]
MSLSTPPQILIDDNFLCSDSSSNNCFTYTGTRWTGSTDPMALERTVHILHAATANSSVINNWSVRFSGTAIKVFGLIDCDNPPCRFDLQVDGGPVTLERPEASLENILQLGADTLGSQSRNHTLTISNSSRVRIDYALVDAPLETPLQGMSAGQLWADLNNTAVVYSGAWHKFYNAKVGGESMQSNTVGDSLRFDFIGDSIAVIGRADPSFPGSVSLNVSVDDGPPSFHGFTSDQQTPANLTSFYIYYTDNSLAPAQHHVEITVAVVTGQQFFDFQGMLYHSSGNTLGDAIASNITKPSSTTAGISVPSTRSSSSSTLGPSSGLNGHSHRSIAAPVAGGVVGATLMVVLLLFWMRRRRQKRSSLGPITPFQQAAQGTTTASESQPGTWAVSSKRAIASAPPSVVHLNRPNGSVTQEESTTVGVLRALVARMDALAMERVPPPYVG